MSELKQILSKAESLKLSKLTYLISHLGTGPFLSLIGVETERLGGAFVEYIKTSISLPLFIQRIESLKQIEEIYNNLKVNKGLSILMIYPVNDEAFDELFRWLLFNRDDITKYNLKVVLICNYSFLTALQNRAADVSSFSRFTYFFKDFQSHIEAELSPSRSFPEELKTFMKSSEDLERYKAKKGKNEELLMRKTFNTAFSAYNISKLDIALSLFNETLALAKKLKITDYQSYCLGNIGLIYSAKGEPDEALKYHKEALSIHRKIGYLQGEANQLGNIGLIYSDKGEPDEALKYLQEALLIDRKIGYLQGEASDLGNIGLIYRDKGEPDEALKYLQEAFNIARSAQLNSLKKIIEENIDNINEEKK